MKHSTQCCPHPPTLLGRFCRGGNVLDLWQTSVSVRTKGDDCPIELGRDVPPTAQSMTCNVCHEEHPWLLHRHGLLCSWQCFELASQAMHRGESEAVFSVPRFPPQHASIMLMSLGWSAILDTVCMLCSATRKLEMTEPGKLIQSSSNQAGGQLAHYP